MERECKQPQSRLGSRGSKYTCSLRNKPTLVSPWNDIWGRNHEIPYWWCVTLDTTQIWLMLLIACESVRFFRLKFLVSPTEKNRRYFAGKRRPEIRLLFTGYASDWLKQISVIAWPISKSATQIWILMRHQHGISVLIVQTSFQGKTNGNRIFYER